MLIFVTGAEERHTSDGVLVTGWFGAMNMVAGLTHTGARGIQHNLAAAGSSPQQVNQGKGWWSYAFDQAAAWQNGTFRYIFSLALKTNSAYIGVVKGSDVNHSKIRLITCTSGTYDSEHEGSVEIYHQVKVEFDEGVWSVWSNISGDWALEISQDDSGTYTELDELRMNVSSSTDEDKGTAVVMTVDDCLMWDSQGDNWNSRIATMSDFPRISAAHFPIANGEWDDLDEIPPDHASKPAADDEDAYYDCESLDDGTKGYEDYTGVTIQAVMITRVDGESNNQQPEFLKFNVYDGSTLYADSEEDGRLVQWGQDGDWWTNAGYYPWTPGEQNWTEELFNSHEYGCHVLTAYTDQVTVQAIYFGSSHEWPPPAGAVRRIFITHN